MKRSNILLGLTLCLSLAAQAAEKTPPTSSVAKAAHYFHEAEQYSSAGNPKKALAAIDHALKLDPHNVKYLRFRGEQANAAGDFAQMEDSYARILRITPNDESALHQHAVVESWQANKIDQAIIDYQKYLKHYPNHAHAWIEYANVQSWKEDYAGSFATLEQYRHRFGKTTEYLAAKARIYALSGDHRTAMQINNPLLAADPKNPDLLYTKVYALNQAHRPRETLAAFHQLQKINPNSSDVKELKKIIDNTSHADTNSNTHPALAENRRTTHLSDDDSGDDRAYGLELQNAQDADKYFHAAEQHAAAGEAKQALAAIDYAVKLEPHSLKYLRSRGELANAAGDSAKMEDSYARVLQITPNDEFALHQHALAESWQTDRMAQAVTDYQYYLTLHPEQKTAWIEYANLQSWRGDYAASLAALEQYSAKFGETKEYLATKARVLALSGRYKSAMKINTPLLTADPKNPDLMYTHVFALNEAHRKQEALLAVNELQKINPDSSDARDLKKVINDSLRSNVTVGGDFLRGSDDIRIMQLPISANIAVTPKTTLIFQGVHERLSAPLESGLETKDDKGVINDDSGWAGASYQLTPAMNVKALGGDTNIDGDNNRFIYHVGADLRVDEKADLSLSRVRTLFRPYLFSTSPLAVSKIIMSDNNVVKLAWEPTLNSTLNMYGSYANLSDDNKYWHVNVSPKMRIYTSPKINISVGVTGDWLGFSQQIDDGYYDPHFHQEYVGVGELGIVPTDGIEYYLSGDAGPHKDANTKGYRLAVDGSTGFIFKLTSFCQLSIDGNYNYSASVERPYHSIAIGSKLTTFF